MAYLVYRSTDATVVDLIANAAVDSEWGDGTKTSCVINSIVLCASARSIVDLRLEKNATAGDDRYIFDGFLMEAGTTVVLDTPIEFDRSIYDLIFSVASGNDVTIHVNYTENKKIVI